MSADPKRAAERTIAGEIDSADLAAGWLLVRVNVSPAGCRIGQRVQVVLPDPDSDEPKRTAEETP